MGFLTSKFAIPLIKIRLWAKKRKYTRRYRAKLKAKAANPPQKTR